MTIEIAEPIVYWTTIATILPIVIAMHLKQTASSCKDLLEKVRMRIAAALSGVKRTITLTISSNQRDKKVKR
jgi:hypothetical protein